jgi:hypothetical protein
VAQNVRWLLVAGLGTVFQQSSFRASSLTASLPTMTVTEPVVASLLGVTVPGETLGADGPKPIALAAAVAVVIVATAALARDEAASMAADDERLVTAGHLPVTAPDIRSRSEQVQPAGPSCHSVLRRLRIAFTQLDGVETVARDHYSAC